MKKGDIIMIYQDPITKQNPDGKAQLISRIPWSDKNVEQWELIFLDDGMQTTRLIQKVIK